MTLAEAQAAERAAFAALGELGEVEIARVKEWVAGGCEGPQPRPDEDARRALTDRLMTAIEAREAAERAAGGHKGARAPDAPAEAEIAASGARCGAAGKL